MTELKAGGKHKHRYVLEVENNTTIMTCECGTNIKSILKGITALVDYEAVDGEGNIIRGQE